MAPCNGGNHAIRDLADDVVAMVGNVYIASGVHREAQWVAQLSACGSTVVTAITRCSGPSDGGDNSARNLADASARVGEIHVAIGVYGDTLWKSQVGAGSWTAVPAEALRAGARHCGDDSTRDFANTIICTIRNVHVAG